MLENVDKHKEWFLGEFSSTISSDGGKNKKCGIKVDSYNPFPSEIIDASIIQKLNELKKERTEAERKKESIIRQMKNAVSLTDIPATIIKAGFYKDGLPRLAISGLFDDKVTFVLEDEKAFYRSRSETFLPVFLGDYYDNWANTPCLKLSKDKIIKVKRLEYYTKKAVSVDVPQVPECVLSQISGNGPFAILFEVDEKWNKVESDPVIFRIYRIGMVQFFEPLVGYDMTDLEKKSLTPLSLPSLPEER